MTALPAEVTLGKVTGLFLVAVTDGVDVDTEPDAQPESGTIKFVPKLTTQRVLAPELMTIINKGVICTLNADGRLVDEQGASGIWLITGAYDVTFSFKNSRILPMTIVVTEAHTELTPLDLALAIPPPGPEVTLGQYAELSDRLGVLEIGGPGGGVSDHGALTGLADDDHPQYALADGSRGAFATVAQGLLAATAVQPAGIAAFITNADPRLTDARTPTAHGHDLDAVTDTATRLALTPAERTKLTNTTGTNSGDQVLPTWATISGKPAVVAAGVDAAAARTAIGAGTSSLVVGTGAGDAKAGNYQPTAANISDSTATGRSVLTAASQSAARTAIGAGTSSLVVGTGAGDAKAGNYQPTAANVSDSTATGRAVMTAVDAAAARTALALGTAATTATTAYATAAQGTKADSAIQSPDSSVLNIEHVTAAEYAALSPPVATTLYVVTV